MITVKVINKIEDKVEEYILKYGSTKTFLAKQMGYNSRQAFEKAVKAEGLSLESYGKFAVFFKCEPTDLFQIKIYDDGKEIDYSEL